LTPPPSTDPLQYSKYFRKAASSKILSSGLKKYSKYNINKYNDEIITDGDQGLETNYFEKIDTSIDGDEEDTYSYEDPEDDYFSDDYEKEIDLDNLFVSKEGKRLKQRTPVSDLSL